MFERFTERARQVIILAQEEARTLKHGYIGTEHILLGLLREEEGLAARVLESLDITVERVRAQVVRIVGSGEEVTSGQIPFTPRAKKVLELALREALSLGHNYIGTEHILLGLVREDRGVASRILLDFDADSEKIRNEVIRMLSGPGGRRSPEPPGSALRVPDAGQFGIRATAVIDRARAEALASQHGRIDTEHILLALLTGEEEDVSLRTLHALGLTADAVRAKLDRSACSLDQTTGGEIEFTPRVVELLSNSLREAGRDESGFIDDRHILLALARQEAGGAARFLPDFGEVQLWLQYLQSKLNPVRIMESALGEADRALQLLRMFGCADEESLRLFEGHLRRARVRAAKDGWL